MEGVQSKAYNTRGELDVIPFTCEHGQPLFSGDHRLPELSDCPHPADRTPENNFSEELRGYKQNYSEPEFWQKIKRYGKVAGASIVYHALLLWYVATKASTPMPVKLLIIGGLGYFIAPADIIPDFLVGLGYGDDAALLIGIISSVVTYIDKESKSKAIARAKELLGDDAEIVSPFS